MLGAVFFRSSQQPQDHLRDDLCRIHLAKDCQLLMLYREEGNPSCYQVQLPEGACGSEVDLHIVDVLPAPRWTEILTVISAVTRPRRIRSCSGTTRTCCRDPRRRPDLGIRAGRTIPCSGVWETNVPSKNGVCGTPAASPQTCRSGSGFTHLFCRIKGALKGTLNHPLNPST